MTRAMAAKATVAAPEKRRLRRARSAVRHSRSASHRRTEQRRRVQAARRPAAAERAAVTRRRRPRPSAARPAASPELGLPRPNSSSNPQPAWWIRTATAACCVARRAARRRGRHRRPGASCEFEAERPRPARVLPAHADGSSSTTAATRIRTCCASGMLLGAARVGDDPATRSGRAGRHVRPHGCRGVPLAGDPALFAAAVLPAPGVSALKTRGGRAPMPWRGASPSRSCGRSRRGDTTPRAPLDGLSAGELGFKTLEDLRGWVMSLRRDGERPAGAWAKSPPAGTPHRDRGTGGAVPGGASPPPHMSGRFGGTTGGDGVVDEQQQQRAARDQPRSDAEEAVVPRPTAEAISPPRMAEDADDHGPEQLLPARRQGLGDRTRDQAQNDPTDDAHDAVVVCAEVARPAPARGWSARIWGGSGAAGEPRTTMRRGQGGGGSSTAPGVRMGSPRRRAARGGVRGHGVMPADDQRLAGSRVHRRGGQQRRDAQEAGPAYRRPAGAPRRRRDRSRTSSEDDEHDDLGERLPVLVAVAASVATNDSRARASPASSAYERGGQREQADEDQRQEVEREDRPMVRATARHDDDPEEDRDPDDRLTRLIPR